MPLRGRRDLGCHLTATLQNLQRYHLCANGYTHKTYRVLSLHIRSERNRMIELLTRLFVKDWQDTASPVVRGRYGMMVSVTGIVLNLLLFAGKFAVGTLFGSVAIRADAINNLSDAGSQLISLISFRISLKPADREHPFGHARIEYVASMTVSFLILVIGVDLFKESVTKIFSPEPPERTYVAVFVLLGSMLVKLWMALLNRRIGKRIDSPVMKATATDSLSDVLSTGAVLVSVLLPLWIPGFTFNIDAFMGVFVAVLILIAGWKLLMDAKNAILGGPPPLETVTEINRILAEYPGALGVHDLEVHNYGPGHVIVTLHVEVDGKKDVFATHDMIDTIEKRLRRECGIQATIHMDPIVTDDAAANALRDEIAAAVREVDGSLTIHDFRFVPGPTHSNLIFDVVAPFECRMSNEEIRRAVASRVSRLNPAYFTVITVDRG